MRDKLNEKIDEMISIIKSSDEYKKYMEISSKMEQDEEIMTLIREIKELQKKIVKEESFGNDISTLDEDINKKIKLLEEYPIYLDYIYLQEDLNNTMQMIKESIEKYLYDLDIENGYIQDLGDNEECYVPEF